ncbi:alpha/beta hydrolase [Halobacteriovorax sp. HLS]|uniref:alpha/beta hydrolase n=1 Tax=Halobacteriovorax sp. HLS TaxID=2234000 RepID=UPI0021018D71|nr:dienelactone hydrolase family protein [Halobacteriovorax sp. HLS]
MKANTSNIDFTFPITYYFENKGKRKLVLLLHGYRMHARKALMDFEQMIPDAYSILAPNGFFPIPKSDKSISRMGYSWYFEDHKSNKSIFSVEQSKNALLSFIESMSLDCEITIVGYSQGAIVGLSLANELDNIKKLVLMSACPLASKYSGKNKLNILAFHGEDDEVISYNYAKEGYSQLSDSGHKVEFISFKNTGHNISSQSSILKSRIYHFLENNNE